MENWQRIAARVNAATAPPPISKAQLARNIGLTRQALQRRINQGGWKYEELKRLANALDTTVDELEAGGSVGGAASSPEGEMR